MRVIHVADTHLGYRNFSGKLDPVRNVNQRECDVYDAWHAAINIALERQHAAPVVITGGRRAGRSEM